MTGSEQRELAILATKFDALESRFEEHRKEAREGRQEVRDEIKELRSSVQEVLNALHGWRGGWKAMGIIATVAGVLGGLAVKFIPFLK